ncbi:SPOR domain-containing protein [Methylobrevis pamukkalensis]|uniref:SPOR domain-containing protein n=1 Tax=Methylobrevis pamukkalensis TaxID=1439726 RepID=UPI001470AE9A|nr:SPOR domain-containing protein [Methylobrevis pamukkalensis]
MIDLGSFANAENARRLASAMEGLGTVSVDDVTSGSRTLKRVRLSNLADGMTPEMAVEAAARAGATGAVVRR